MSEDSELSTGPGTIIHSMKDWIPSDGLIYTPNESGSTQCIVRWMLDTPYGSVGAWDKLALEWIKEPVARQGNGQLCNVLGASPNAPEYRPAVAAAPTPETDAFYAALVHSSVPSYMVESGFGKERDFARKLEKERDEARAELAAEKKRVELAISRIELVSSSVDIALDEYLNDIRALATLPIGHCVVPVEPTEDMLRAAGSITGRRIDTYACSIYKAMLTARE